MKREENKEVIHEYVNEAVEKVVFKGISYFVQKNTPSFVNQQLAADRKVTETTNINSDEPCCFRKLLANFSRSIFELET